MLSWWVCRGQDLGRIDSLIVLIVGLWGCSLCLHLKVLLEELRELQRFWPTPPSSLVIIPVDQGTYAHGFDSHPVKNSSY